MINQIATIQQMSRTQCIFYLHLVFLGPLSTPPNYWLNRVNTEMGMVSKKMAIKYKTLWYGLLCCFVQRNYLLKCNGNCSYRLLSNKLTDFPFHGHNDQFRTCADGFILCSRELSNSITTHSISINICDKFIYKRKNINQNKYAWNGLIEFTNKLILLM